MGESTNDLREEIASAVRVAAAAGTPLEIRGGGTKSFLGRAATGMPLELGEHRGIVSYAATELTLTARAGTRLSELQAELAANGQWLPFDPPAFGAEATLGGTIACGLSGPRRPYAGAARDFVLGTRIVNGRGEILRLGGEVIKNVAGYDLSRLMTGAMGTLGVLLDVSLKVLPRPVAEQTLVFELDAATALTRANQWAARPLPLDAIVHLDGRLYVRLAASAAGVEHAVKLLGGERLDDGRRLWDDWREQRHAFFAGDTPLWRLSMPSTAPPLQVEGDCAIDWGGGLRWLRSRAEVADIRAEARRAGGHAMLFRAGDTPNDQPCHPLDDGLRLLHQRLKESLDPQRVLNRGRMYADL